MRKAVLLGLVFVLAAAFLYFVPFEPGSYVFYAGVGSAAAGLVGCVWRFLGSRRRGLAVLGGGVVLAVVGLMWPYELERTARRHLIDDFMPEYHFREVHSTVVPVAPGVAFQAARDVTFGELYVYRALVGIRQIAAGHSPKFPGDDRAILATMTKPGAGFLPLAEEPGREIVFGGVMNFRGVKGIVLRPNEWAGFRQPGWIKVIFNLRFEAEGAGTRVTTETRTLGTDEPTARFFARYWRAVYPGSAVLRTMWLRAIASRARRGRNGTPPLAREWP